MRNYAKTGGKPGRPAYRTPSAFLHKQALVQSGARKTRRKKQPVLPPAGQPYLDEAKRSAIIGK